jgi:hypothetical protein
MERTSSRKALDFQFHRVILTYLDHGGHQTKVR